MVPDRKPRVDMSDSAISSTYLRCESQRRNCVHLAPEYGAQYTVDGSLNVKDCAHRGRLKVGTATITRISSAAGHRRDAAAFIRSMPAGRSELSFSRYVKPRSVATSDPVLLSSFTIC